MKLENCWLSPLGDIYPCVSFCHWEKACEIVKQYNYPLRDLELEDEALLARGWVRISFSKFIDNGWNAYWERPLSDIQKKMLAESFENEVVTDYTRMRWEMEVDDER